MFYRTKKFQSPFCFVEIGMDFGSFEWGMMMLWVGSRAGMASANMSEFGQTCGIRGSVGLAPCNRTLDLALLWFTVCDVRYSRLEE